MSLFSFLRSIYDVDTLDTRFTTPSTVPYKQDTPSSKAAGHNGTLGHADSRRDAAAEIVKRAEPSKWRTPEFFVYYFIFLTVVPYMFWVAYDVSRPSDPRYAKYEDKLAPGWIPGRNVDTSDSQYHTFRSNLPYMALLLVFHPLLRKAWNSVFPTSTSASTSSPTRALTPDQANARKEQRLSFDYVFAFVFLVALHGISAAKVLAILWINYNLATTLPRQYVPVATWVFNIGTLFANELASGYHLVNVASLISEGSWEPIFHATIEGHKTATTLVNWGSWLDGFGGIMPRWEILFNITVLRLISFNLDYYWSHGDRGSSPLEKKQLDPASLSERDRVTISAPPQDYSFRNYVAYAIYAPLYLTGPIVSFNDFVHQARYRPATIEGRRTLRYGVRFVLCLLAMELVLHYDYVGAISQSGPNWSSYTSAQLSLLSFFNLHLIWLKLLLPWRLFRLWSLLDGVDPPENMLRCVSNNYSTLSFWRAWHRSYNRWLVRYIWIPLGGSNFKSWLGAARSLLTYMLVFTFVALWHDIQLRLLIWGWLVVLFFVPEVLASFLFPRRRWSNRPTAYRMLCCAGAVINILMMMSANLVGFAVGLDGLQSIVHGIVHDWSGFLFLITACGALFVGVQVMFEIRQSEMRRGILLKC
ncbi:glycerol transporter [Sporothrix stenoceras]|uniref:Glycerol transporter n=1 Tax=Sporothrix stenoceras TaxID=5173 RepID=A0ABR3ZTW6_9PEZI